MQLEHRCKCQIHHAALENATAALAAKSRQSPCQQGPSASPAIIEGNPKSIRMKDGLVTGDLEPIIEEVEFEEQENGTFSSCPLHEDPFASFNLFRNRVSLCYFK